MNYSKSSCMSKVSSGTWTTSRVIESKSHLISGWLMRTTSSLCWNRRRSSRLRLAWPISSLTSASVSLTVTSLLWRVWRSHLNWCTQIMQSKLRLKTFSARERICEDRSQQIDMRKMKKRQRLTRLRGWTPSWVEQMCTRSWQDRSLVCLPGRSLLNMLRQWKRKRQSNGLIQVKIWRCQ